MKKILVTLLVLALCAPAMAATVTITDNADGTGTVTVTAEGAVNIVGLGLDVDATAGGNITAATSDTATFNIYPDAAYTLAGGYTYGAGTPIADQAVAGEVAISNSFALSVGALNGAGTAGATGAASVSFTITVDADTTIEIKENAARGGIVLTDGSGEDITNGTGGVVTGTITVGPTGPTCQDWNLTKLLGGTDNLVNVGDVNNFISYVNANKTGSFFVVNGLNPAYNEVYNITKRINGGTDNLINVSDLNALISYINATKAGSFFVVNCNTCGC